MILYMGINSGVKGYHVWCLETKKLILSRDATFVEFVMLKKVTKGTYAAGGANSEIAGV